MNLTIERNLTTYNFSDRNDVRRIKWIVIHYFGSLGSAKSVANYFASAYRGASAHYALDNTPIVYQSVEDEDIAWHCGTDGTYYHAQCRNSNSIGIEVMPYKIDKSRSAYASDTDWYFSEDVINNLVEFTKYLMGKYGIDADHVIRHYDVTHKLCPRPYVGDDINDYHKVSGNTMWDKFKQRLTAVEQEEDMPNINELTDAQITELWGKLIQPLKDNDSSDWSQQGRQFAMDNGIIVGDGTGNYQWEAPLTREAMCVMLYRFAQFMGKV